MLSLAVSEFWRNAKRNIPLMLFLSAMAMVLIMIFSIIRYQYAMFYPFSHLQNREGFYYMGEGDEIDWEDNGVTAEVYRYYNTNIYASQQQNSSYQMFVSPEWIWGSWKPRLQSGRWFSALDQQLLRDEDVIPVVLGGSDAYNYPVGCVIGGYTSELEELRLCVIGIMQENTAVLGASKYYHAGKVNYQMFYDIPYDNLFFIAQWEALEQKGVNSYAMANTLVVLEDLDSEKEQELWEELSRSTGGACLTLKEFNSANRSLLLQELVTYLPLVATGLVLILVCTYAVIYVNQIRGERHYSIFYLVGADRKKRFLLCMGNGFGVVLLSAAMCLFTAEWLYLLGAARKTYFLLDGISAGILGGYYFVYVLLTGGISLASLKDVTPREALIRGSRW